MNSIVQQHRQMVPNDPRSDADITLDYGDTGQQNPDIAAALQSDPEFQQQYAALDQQRTKDNASVTGEFSKGAGQATHSLLATTAGALAMLAKAVGADGAHDYYREIAQNQEKNASDYKLAVPRYEDVHGVRDALLYGAQGVGQVLPSLGEAGVTTLAGAAVGSAIEPGVGTIGGAIEGAVERNLIKKFIADGLEESVASAAAKSTARELIKKNLPRIAGDLSNVVNAYGLSSGEIYNDLASNPNVEPDTALKTAAGYGLLAAIPDTFLPHYALGKVFPGAKLVEGAVEHGADQALTRHYLARLGKDSLVAFPAEAGTEAAQELVGVLAGKSADPTQRNTSISPEEWSRIVNAGIIGGLGGVALAPVSAIHPEHEQTQISIQDRARQIATQYPEAIGPEFVQPNIAPQGPQSAPDQSEAFRQRVADITQRAREAAVLAASGQPGEAVAPGVNLRDFYSQAGDRFSDLEALHQVIQSERERILSQHNEQPITPEPQQDREAVQTPPPAEQPAINPQQEKVNFNPQDFVSMLDIEDGSSRPFVENLPQGNGALVSTLTQSSRGHDQESNSDRLKTKRGTFFLDTQTGKVLVLGTYLDTRDKLMVVNPDPNSRTNVSMDRLDTARYTPLSSVLFKNAGRGIRLEFTPEEYLSIKDATKSAIVKTANEQRANEESLTAHSPPLDITSEDNTRESSPVEVPSTELEPKMAASSQPEEAYYLPPSAVEKLRIRKIGTELAGEIHTRLSEVGNPNPSVIDVAHTLGEIRNSGTRGQKLVLELVGGLKSDAVEQILNHIRDVYEKTGDERASFEKQIGSRSLDEISGGGHGGDETDEQFSFRNPGESGRATNGEYKARLAQVAEAFQRNGYTTEFEKAALKEVGRISNKNKVVVFSLFDAENPSLDNLRLALHEVGHAVLDKVPRKLRDTILQAIDSYSDEQLGIQNSADERIRLNNPAGLSRPVLSEERLAEHFAQSGVDREVSTSLASQIVRMVKEVYYRLAIAAQKALGRPVSESLALAYAQNRFERFLGDKPMALSRFLIPPTQAELQQEDRFTVRRAFGEGLGDRDNPEVILNSRIAAHNEHIEVERVVDDALTNTALANVAKQSGGTAIDAFRQEFGLDDPNQAKKEELAKAVSPTTGVAIPVNDKARLTDIQSEQNKARAAGAAWEAVHTAAVKVASKLSDFTSKLEDLGKKIDKQQEDVKAANEDYTNVSGLTAKIKAGFQKHVDTFIDKLQTTSENLGVIGHQLQDLEDGGGKGIVSIYAPAFKKLFTGRELDGQKLYSFLEAMATDPSIDFSQGIRDIRSALKAANNPKYDALLQNTPESKALLASVVSYGKINQKFLLAIELGKLNDSQRRLQINAEIKALMQGNEKITADMLRELPRKAALEDRVKVALRKEKSELRGLLRDKEELERNIKAGNAVVGIYSKEADRLGGVNGEHEPFYLEHGATYRVPKDDGSFETKTFRIDTTARDGISSQPELTKDIEAMAKYLDANKNNKTSTWFQIQHQFAELAAGAKFSGDIRATDHSHFVLKLSDAATQLKSLGTPSSRLAAQMINQYAAHNQQLRDLLTPLALNVERARGNAIRLANVTPEYYRENIYKPAVAVLQRARDLAELHRDFDSQMNAGMRRVRKAFLENNATKSLADNTAFMDAVRKHISAEWEVSKEVTKFQEDHGIYVRDNGVQRKHINVGIVTLPEGFSPRFHAIFDFMSQNGWGRDVFKDILKDPEAQQKLSALFGERVWKDFVGELANTDTFTGFRSPVMIDNVTHQEANPAFVRQAYRESGGNVAQFAKRLYELHAGSTPFDAYFQDVLDTFQQAFNEDIALQEKARPDRMAMPTNTFSNMVPDIAVDARRVSHLPASWKEPLSFDRGSSQSVAQRVAAETAFGVGGKRIESVYNVAVKETKEAVDKLDQAVARSKAEVASGKRKDTERFIEEAVGGKEELSRLRKLKQRQDFLTGPKSVQHQLAEYFQRKQGNKLIDDAIGLMSTAMINQFSSAIAQTAAVFDTLFHFGGATPAAIRMVSRTGFNLFSEATGSLAEAIGITTKARNELQKAYVRIGANDPEQYSRRLDALIMPQSTNMNSYGLFDNAARGASKMLHFTKQFIFSPTTVSKDAPANYVQFRLFAPFNWVSIVTNKGATMSFWQEVASMVHKGVEHLKANGDTEELAGRSLSDWSKALELGKGDAEFFRQTFTKSLDDWGLDYSTLVKEGMSNLENGNYVLSDRNLRMLHHMIMKEVGAETNISTTSLSAFNNSIVKRVIPLMGWAFRRTIELPNGILDERGKASYSALARMLTGTMLAVGGSLAVSALVDWYAEELLRKKRNLRSLASLDPLAVVEHTARIGTLGFFGDLLNQAVNVGTGEGANRDLSLDGRIVAVNAMRGLINTISTFVNQEGTVDYATFYRPLAYNIGANGMIQYMDLANTAFGLDNAESRAVARTNTGNWLRTVGRELGIEIRPASSGYSTPTPITPFVTRMQLAAYAGDSGDFKSAYQDAVTKAKEEGHADPAGYIKSLFESRHPLKSIFRAPPTEPQVQQIMNAMPDSGREDVGIALQNYNRFLLSLGAKPFDGRQEKSDTGFGRGGKLDGLNSISDLRLKAGSLSAQFGAGGF